MKLSQLVAMRNALDQYDIGSVKHAASLRLAEVVLEFASRDYKLSNASEQMDLDIQNIGQAFDKFNETLFRAKRRLNQEIEIEGKKYFAESYRLYEQEMIYEPVQYILERKMALSQDAEQVILGRMQSNSDWKYPGLVIRPGQEKFIESLVSFDPLYIVDTDYDLLRPALDRFPPAYQRRLRTYVINEREDEDILAKIPDDQFGMCLVYNFFNYKPFEVIKQYLQEIFKKLRPGGTLYMTINDCDRAHCVSLVEKKFTCYTPGGMLRDLAISMGYEQIFTYTDGSNLCWVELRKPGTLTSLRGGQTLAKVLLK